MNNVLVVANRTIVSANLTERIYEMAQAGPLTVQLVVPRLPLADRTGLTDAAAAQASLDRANKNLWSGIRAISKLGIAVTGQLGPSDPMAAVKAMTDQYEINTILISSLPLGTSRWLAMDLPHRIARRFSNCDVQHVVGFHDEESVNVVAPGEKVNILLVEDDENDVELAIEALDQCNFEVDVSVARDGEQALKHLRDAEQQPHLLLLDLKMPRVDGHEFLDRLRTDLSIDALNELFVAVVSSSSADVDRRRAHALGAQAYLVKTPSFNLFSDTLASIVSEVAIGISPPRIQMPASGLLAGARS